MRRRPAEWSEAEWSEDDGGKISVSQLPEVPSRHCGSRKAEIVDSDFRKSGSVNSSFVPGGKL